MITLPPPTPCCAPAPAGRQPAIGRLDTTPGFSAPRRRARHWLDRPALTHRLTEALAEHRLVLLQAAAGHGKTSALSDAVRSLPAGTACAWVDIHPGDDLPAVLQALVEALSPWDLPWPSRPASLLALAAADENTSRQRAAVMVVQALAGCPAPAGVIVLDGLDRVDDGPMFEFVDLVLSRLDPRWALAITTRHEPPLTLARLRAWGEVALFRAEDLQFDATEVVALATRAGLGRAAAVALHERARGWVAGVQLGLGHDAERAIADFLRSEVIDALDASLRRFLLQVSVLPTLTAENTAALTGHVHAAFLLEAIERLDLFLESRPHAGAPLRLQPLFRHALQQQLQREQPQAWQDLGKLAQALQPTAAPVPAAPACETAPGPAAASPEALSPREAEVLARMAAGDSNKAIARALDLSPHTVKRHVANILGKLGATSRVQAAALARPAR